MIIHATDHDCKNKISNSQNPVILDFYADWCQPCKILSKTLTDLDNENVTIIKIDVEECLMISQKYMIKSIPTLIFIKNNQIYDQIQGTTTKEKIMELIK